MPSGSDGIDERKSQRPTASPVRGAQGVMPFVWAHRGACALAPENTLQSFLVAAELGAPGIEFDVQLTRDGMPVILHDPWLWSDGDSLVLRPSPGELGGFRRLTIAACRWEEIAEVPVEHPDGRREAVPRLEDVLEAVPSWLWLDVELKAGWRYDPRLADIVVFALKRRHERVLASSFDHRVLREVAQVDPELPLLAICHARLVDPAAVAATIPTTMICIDRPFLTAGDVEEWHGVGLEVSVGGPELVDDLEEVLTWPVSGVFLDDPRLAVRPPGA